MTYSLNTLQSSSAEGQPVRARAMRFAHEITLIAGFVALLFRLLAMLSFTPSDAAWSTSGTGGDVKNWGGRIGAWVADASYFLAGYSVWWCLAAGTLGAGTAQAENAGNSENVEDKHYKDHIIQQLSVFTAQA